ncbi:Lrp/AsnC family transcriptional regulator [Candidatus Bathyarchaeota archaeon]|nr:Lrp/AsnC family transcriptional regulator [Candidatus Bathyarchaeota archaeon]
MSKLLDDQDNLKLMEALISGNAVSVNISELARLLGKHRNTIKNKVDAIFDHKIIDLPVYPFHGLYKVYPLLAVVNLDIPDRKEAHEGVIKWVKEDPQIFAAFRSRQGEYDTILFTYHEDITAYQLWMSAVPSILKINYGVAEEYSKFESSTAYFSNQLMIKYNPSTGINLIEKDYLEKGGLGLRGYELDELDMEIIRCLVNGKGIKTNHTLLCEKTGLHRKTIEKRIAALKEDGLLGNPVSRFPDFFVPPNYLLTYVLVQFKNLDERVLNEIIIDTNIPIAIQTIHGKFNLLLFGNHSSLNDHLQWEEKYRTMFPDSFGSAHITYLSPEMTINSNQQSVGLNYIRSKMGDLLEIDLGRTIRQLERARARVLYNLPKGG